MRNSKPLRSATGAGIGALALLVAGLPATAAIADETPPTWVSTKPAQAVTLITGDKVTLHDGTGKTPIVEFTPAPRDSGAPVSYSAYGDDEHYYVIPSDVAGLVPAQLDVGLFDVKALAGLDATDGVPVIVQSDGATDAKSDAAAWKALDLEPDRTLESIDAVAGEVPAEGAPALVEAAAEGDEVEKVWLDSPVQLTDTTSTPQIGAPAAWEAGLDGTGAVVAVIDSGIDTTHPDLDDGVVIAAKDFTGSGSTKDLKGHGTHVASIIAGSGEASDGANRGVAYGAKLLNARVLNGQGYGQESWIIDGMEWAAEQGADVINMSLGVQGEYTDGTDPGALAVDSLSARYDTLVVIAAGNDGTFGSTTVTTPGTAQSALTVGAIDEQDQLAGFSSTGPRFGDAGVKPDVTAPGAWILAARASGTRPDVPVDDKYVYDGGTSMAAPHVAGAAAILRAARPELDGEAIKALLMGTARPTVGSIWKEGAGKIYVPDAVGEPLYATDPSLSFGVFTSPRATQGPRTKMIEYTNTQGTDLTLNVWAVGSGSDGAPVPPGMITLSSSVVTVPAHGKASVEVTVDPRVDDPGFYTGVVTAAGDGFAAVRTVLGYQVEDNLAVAQLEAVQPDGAPAASGTATLYNLDDPSIVKAVRFADGKAEARLPLGRYAILGTMLDAKPGAALFSGATLFTRDLDLTTVGDHPIVIDGTKAIPAAVTTEKKAQVTNVELLLDRTLPGWGRAVQQSAASNAVINSPGASAEVYVLAEGDLAGDVTLSQSWLLGAPELDAAVTAGSQSVDLAEDLRYAITSPELKGSVNAAIVPAGAGTPDELQKAGVRGRIALVEARPTDVNGVHGLLVDQAQAAKDAGATALIVYGATDGPYWEDVENLALGYFPDKALPTLTLPRAKGLELLALTAAKKGAKLVGTGYGYSPYDYEFAKVEHGIPASLTYHLDGSNTAAVQSTVKTQLADALHLEWHTITTSNSFIGFNRPLDEPIENRTIYYFADPGVRFQLSAEPFSGGNQGSGTTSFPTAFRGPLRSYVPGETATQTLLGQVVHGGLLPDPASPAQASVRRDGETLMVDLPYRVDGDGNPNVSGPDGGTDSRMELSRDGQSLGGSEYASGSWTSPAEEHTYRLAFQTHRFERWWTQSTDVTTEWTFKSAATDTPTVLPLLQLDYGVQGLSGLNVAPAKKVTLTPTVSHQDGSTGAEIQGLKLWASYDTGKTWAAVTVTGSAGSYSASIVPPKGTTKVSLKSEAWDAAGNTFKETVIDALAVQ